MTLDAAQTLGWVPPRSHALGGNLAAPGARRTSALGCAGPGEGGDISAGWRAGPSDGGADGGGQRARHTDSQATLQLLRKSKLISNF